MKLIAFIIVVIVIAIWVTAMYMSSESAIGNRRKKERAVRRRILAKKEHARANAMAQRMQAAGTAPIRATPATGARTFQPSPVNMVMRSGS